MNCVIAKAETGMHSTSGKNNIPPITYFPIRKVYLNSHVISCVDRPLQNPAGWNCPIQNSSTSL